MKRTLTLLTIAGFYCASLTYAEGEMKSPPSTPDQEEALFSGWLYGMAICAGTVLQKERLAAGATPKNGLFEVNVTTVFFGDPGLKTLYVPSTSSPLIQPGQKILLAVRSDFYAQKATVVLDTAVNRSDLQKAIAARGKIRVGHGFLDLTALLDESEALLQCFIGAIATRLPDHPYLGKTALKSIAFHRCKAPLGVYIQVMESYTWKGCSQQMCPLPNTDGIVLWVAAALEEFQVGHPSQLGQSAFLGLAGDKELDWEERQHLKNLSLSHPPIAGPLSLILDASYIDPTGKGEVGKALRQEFLKLREQLQQVNRDPPRDLDGAIAEVVGHKSVPYQIIPQQHINLFKPLYGSSTLGQAYEALSSTYAIKHLSGKQKHLLIPHLIDQLLDITVVHNSTPSDGPIILSHQMAYALLKQLTGKELPPPLSQERGGHRPWVNRPPPPATDQKTEQAEISKRFAAWNRWWEKEKKASGFSACD